MVRVYKVILSRFSAVGLMMLALLGFFSSTAYAVTITSPTNGAILSGNSATLSGTGTPYATIILSESGQTLAALTVDGDGTWTTSLTGLAIGTHSVKVTEIGSAYGYFSAAGESNTINRVLSGTTQLNPGGGAFPLSTTGLYLLPNSVNPLGGSIYFGGTGQPSDIPVQFTTASPADPDPVAAYPSNPSVSPGAFTADGLKLYIPNNDLSTVSVVDTANNVVTGSINIASGYMPYAARSQDGMIYIVAGADIKIINPATDTVTQTIPISCPTTPNGIGLIEFPVGRDYYYITCAQDGIILKYDTLTNTQVGTIDISASHVGIGALIESLDGNRLYVGGIYSGPTGDKISVVDTSSGGVITQITLTAASFTGTMSPDGQYIYAATQGAFDTTNIDVISTQSNQIINQIDTSSLGVPGVVVWDRPQELSEVLSFTVSSVSGASSNTALAKTGVNLSLVTVFAGISLLVAATYIYRIHYSNRLD